MTELANRIAISHSFLHELVQKCTPEIINQLLHILMLMMDRSIPCGKGHRCVPTLSWHHQFPYDLITPVHVFSQWQICVGVGVPKHPQNHSGHPKNIYIFSYIIVKILLHNYSMVPSVKSDKRISQRQDKTGKTFIFFLCWLMWSRPIKLDAPIMNISFAPPKLLSQLCSCVVSSIMHWGYCFMSKFTLSWHPEVDNDIHDQLAYINCV